MTFILRPTSAFAVALLAAGQAAAAPPPAGASFGAPDPAAIPCALFLKMLEKAPTGTERQFYDWANGYFAGRSDGSDVARRLPADGPGRTAAFRQLTAFCGAYPEARFEEAVLALWNR